MSPPDSGSGQGTPITAVQTAYEAIPWFSAVWAFTTGPNTYTNNTLAARSTSDASAFSVLTQTSSYLYLGSESRFDLIYFDRAQTATMGALTWQYYDGTGWISFAPTYNYDFTADGVEGFTNLINWTPLAFSATVPHAATPPDTRARYWIRIQPASITMAPTINQIQMRPYAGYCTATEVAQQLQLDADFSSSTNPTRNTVEDYINRAQAYIDYKTWKSWRLNYMENEEYAFNMSGFKLAKRDARIITRLQVWTGSEWQTKTQGRQSDYELVASTNMVYWTRYFLLPARMQAYNAPLWAWGAGEFEFPVRVSYVYGRNIYDDQREGPLVKDIAKKLAASDVMQNHDYSVLLASGADNVRLQEKIRNWKEEIDEKLEAARSWIIF